MTNKEIRTFRGKSVEVNFFTVLRDIEESSQYSQCYVTLKLDSATFDAWGVFYDSNDREKAYKSACNELEKSLKESADKNRTNYFVNDRLEQIKELQQEQQQAEWFLKFTDEKTNL